MLSAATNGTNWDGGDGKMAQATILAAIKFSAPIQVTTTSPIEPSIWYLEITPGC
jgi:hypothetical protein